MPGRLLALLSLGLLALAGEPIAAQTELRGTWVARDGLTSRAKIIATLDQLATANINLVCVNVWSRGFTIHPSDVLFAACGQRQDPTFVGRDPLAEFVLEAHRRGIEVEAWFEYGFQFGWSGWFPGPTGVGPVLTANPNWIARDQNNNSQVPDGGGGFFTWAIHQHPDVRRFLLDLAVELVDRYDVDGVQFDRVRYPSTDFGYDATTRALYQAATGQPPPSNPNLSAWKRWRADGLTAFCVELYDAVKARRPDVRVTNAPVIMPLSYDSFLQDWPDWLVAGALDLVYPQVYRTTIGSYTTTLDAQLQITRPVDRARIAPGIRAITGTPTSAVVAMVGANRTRNLPGQVFWYAEGLYDDLPQLVSQHFQNASAVPQRPPGFRPLPIEREESDPTTTLTPGFLVLAVSGSNGGAAAVAPPTANASDVVTYSLPVPATGLYRVLTHVPTGAGGALAVPHRVTHAVGVEEVPLDQTAAPGTIGWNDLGTWWLTQGTTQVTIGAVPGQFTTADTVALLRSRFLSGAMTIVGPGTTGSAGSASLSMAGRAVPGGRLRLYAERLGNGAAALWTLGFQAASTPLFGGTLHLAPTATTFAFTDGRGRARLDVPLPFDPSLTGLPIRAQLLAIDAGATGGVVLTNAVGTMLP